MESRRLSKHYCISSYSFENYLSYLASQHAVKTPKSKWDTTSSWTSRIHHRAYYGSCQTKCSDRLAKLLFTRTIKWRMWHTVWKHHSIQFPAFHSNFGKNSKLHVLCLWLNIILSWNIERNEYKQTLTKKKKKIKIPQVVTVSKYELNALFEKLCCGIKENWQKCFN